MRKGMTMALVTISEASSLTGKSIKTIYRHIDTGKLSSTLDENNKKQVDTAELVRVDGEIKIDDELLTKNDNTKMSLIENKEERKKERELEIENENKILKERIGHLEAILSEKQSHIDSLKQAMLLLEDKSKNDKENEKQQPSDKKFWWKIFS